MTYYNEFDPHTAAWLRELMRDGLIPAGEVDERSIKDVAAVDLVGRQRCHFFAGIAGWELALQLAGWDATRPVWTGSCPCQPYSSAGKRRGNADERDLWPDFFRLIRECRPQCVFGEQVEGAVRHGWLDRVHADMEGEGYTVGAVVLGAHSVGAPHIRQRLYWVVHTKGGTPRSGDDVWAGRGQHHARRGGGTGGVGDASVTGSLSAAHAGVPCAEEVGVQKRGRVRRRSAGSGCVADGVAQGDANKSGPQGRGVSGCERAGERTLGATGGDVGFWTDSVLIPCRDGKQRRVPTEPALFPLAHGVPGRVGLLRGAGNAIVPQVAAAFVRAFLEEEAEVATE